MIGKGVDVEEVQQPTKVGADGADVGVGKDREHQVNLLLRYLFGGCAQALRQRARGGVQQSTMG